LADRAIYESSQLPRNLEYRCDFIFHELVVGLMLEDGRDLSKPEEQDRVIAINNALADFRDSEGAINDTQLFRMLDQSPNLVGFPRSNLNRLNAAFAREIQLYQDTCRSGQRYVAAHGRGDDYFSQMAHRNLSVIEGRSIIPFEDYDTQQAYARAGSYSPAQRLMQDIGGIAYMMRLSHVGVETHATPVEGRNWSFAIDCPKVQATVSAGGFVLSPHFELKLGGINGSVPELEVQGAAIGR
jgi:hypothetical protein